MRRNRHLIAAWLSLFAMLMIFLGPLISQGQSLAHGVSQPVSMAGMSCDDMPGMGKAADQSATDQHHAWGIWEKCGYCSLLFQHPPLTESHPLLVRLSAQHAVFVPPFFTPQPATPPIFPGARTRAPPRLNR